MPKCSLSYAKIEQIESRKAKLAWAVMPRCSLSYAKIHIIYTLKKLYCEKLNFDLAAGKGSGVRYSVGFSCLSSASERSAPRSS